MMKYQKLTFGETQLTFPSLSQDGTIEYVMMDWETTLMEHHAKLICYNKGDILEIGFGMGISANFIQSHNPKSHTIIEIHPEVAKKAIKWSENKSGVKIIEGDWFECLSQLEKYDGVFFDTFADGNVMKFGGVVESLVKVGAHVSWWNSLPIEENFYGIDGVIYSKHIVNPPPNNYFNFKEYLLPLKIF